MIEVLNLQCHYKVTSDSQSSIYSFITSDEVEYNVVFIDSTDLFTGTSTGGILSGIYQINVDKITEIYSKPDPYIKETIECIVNHFFSDKEKALLYICDNADDKNKVRRRKFNGWFTGSVNNYDFIKRDEDFETDHGLYLTSMIYHIQHPFRGVLEKSYSEVIQSLLEKPQTDI